MTAEREPEEIPQSPTIPSPYGDGPIPTYRHLKLSAFWFATNFLWGALITIMLPNELKHIAPHSRVFALSFLTAVGAIVPILVPLIVGALSDRCANPMGRRRPFIIWGTGINLLGLGLMGLAYHQAGVLSLNLGHEPTWLEGATALLTSPGFLLFLAAFMVVQFGNNIATAAYTGLIPDLVPQNQRGAASGYMAIMSQVGTLAGVVFSGIILGPFPEGIKYFVLAAVLALVAIITVTGIRETPLPKAPDKIDWSTYAKSLWIDPRKHQDFAWVWITRFLVMLGFYAVIPYINYYLTDVIKIEKPDGPAAILTATILVFSTFSGFYGGVLSDRIGRKRVVFIANLSMALVGLGFIFCRSFAEVMIVGIIFGLGYGAYVSVDWALGTDVLPSKDDAAKEMAVWHIAMTLPQTIAAPVAGMLIESFGKSAMYKGDDLIVHYTPGGYSAVFFVASVCFGAGALLLRNVRSVK